MAPALRELEKDGLIVLDGRGLTLSKAGQPFLRHVCKAFDLNLLRDEKARGEGFIRCGKSASEQSPLFSNAI